MFTTEQWQQKAVSEVSAAGGGEGGNALIEVRLPLATGGGTFALTVNGDSTAAIPYNVSAGALQTALESLGSLGAGNVVVSGMKKGPYLVEMRGELAGQPVPETGYFLGDGSLLSPSAILTPAVKRQGFAPVQLSTAVSLWGNYTSLRTDELRYLYVKRELLKTAIATAAGMVDSRDADAESKDSQRFNQLRAMYAQTESDILTADQLSVAEARNQTYTVAPDKVTPNGLPFGQLRPRGFGGYRC